MLRLNSVPFFGSTNNSTGYPATDAAANPSQEAEKLRQLGAEAQKRGDTYLASNAAVAAERNDAVAAEKNPTK